LSDGYLNWLWQPEPWSRKARRDPAFQSFAQDIGMVAYWKRYGCRTCATHPPEWLRCIRLPVNGGHCRI
jgi:hypothetical protein